MFTSPVWLKAFSGLMLNLSAGWFGAVFILTGLGGEFRLWYLTVNLFYGILSLVLHVALEVLIKNESK